MLETNPKPENLRINGRFDKDGAIDLLTHHIVGSINNAFSSNMSIQWTIPTGILSDVFSLSILEYVTSLIWRRTKHDRERRVMTKTNTLSPIEDAIVCTSNSICENIAALSDKPKLLSQNILQYVRNLVEYTSQRVSPGEKNPTRTTTSKRKRHISIWRTIAPTRSSSSSANSIGCSKNPYPTTLSMATAPNG